MSELDHQIRNLVDGDVRPITFEEIALARLRPPREWRQPLIATSCGVGVLAAAVAAVVLSGAGSDGPSAQVVSSPGSSTPAPDGSKVLTLPSESMSPTLRAGDRYTITSFASANGEPARGDVVALPVPAASAITDTTHPLVKRVVGLPGETIEGRDGRIFIDGVLLDEVGYLLPAVRSSTFGPVAVPTGTYFLLGDNRPYSQDSTHFGPVPRTDLLGIVDKVG